MCSKHKTYKAIHAPRTDCLDCWKQYAITLRDRTTRLEECVIKYLGWLQLTPKTRSRIKRDLEEDLNDPEMVGRE